jgi:hypothetical protein
MALRTQQAYKWQQNKITIEKNYSSFLIILLFKIPDKNSSNGLPE